MKHSRPSPESILFLVLFLLRLSLPVGVQAATTNCGTQGSHFDGAQVNQSGGSYQIRGTRGDIEIRDPDLCTADDSGQNFSTAWSMMNAPDNTGWAQIGYFRSVGSLRFFWQYMKDNSVPQSQRVTATYFWGDPVVGDMKRFKVERTGGGGHIHMFLGNNEAPCKPSGECPETPFDPLNAWNGTESQWYGETGWGR